MDKDINSGIVVQVIGPIVDIKFKDQTLPELLTAIHIDNNGKLLTVEVALWDQPKA